MKFQFPSKFGWKNNLLHFRNDFWVLFISLNGFKINFPNLEKPWELCYRSISSSRGDRWNPELGAKKTQIFKVLRFEPNFRGRLHITSNGTPWNNFIKKPLTKWFIHDWSGLYAFPQALSMINTSSSKFSPMAPRFWDLVFNPSNMSRKPIKGFQNLGNHFLSLIFHLPVDSSP